MADPLQRMRRQFLLAEVLGPAPGLQWFRQRAQRGQAGPPAGPAPASPAPAGSASAGSAGASSASASSASASSASAGSALVSTAPPARDVEATRPLRTVGDGPPPPPNLNVNLDDQEG